MIWVDNEVAIFDGTTFSQMLDARVLVRGDGRVWLFVTMVLLKLYVTAGCERSQE